MWLQQEKTKQRLTNCHKKITTSKELRYKPFIWLNRSFTGIIVAVHVSILLKCWKFVLLSKFKKKKLVPLLHCKWLFTEGTLFFAFHQISNNLGARMFPNHCMIVTPCLYFILGEAADQRRLIFKMAAEHRTWMCLMRQSSLNCLYLFAVI